MPAQFRTGEDWLFFLRLTERGDFVFYREDLARLHRHDENLTHGRVIDRTTKEKLRGYRALLDGSAGIGLTPAQSEPVLGFYRQASPTGATSCRGGDCGPTCANCGAPLR